MKAHTRLALSRTGCRHGCNCNFFSPAFCLVVPSSARPWTDFQPINEPLTSLVVARCLSNVRHNILFMFAPPLLLPPSPHLPPPLYPRQYERRQAPHHHHHYLLSLWAMASPLNWSRSCKHCFLSVSAAWRARVGGRVVCGFSWGFAVTQSGDRSCGVFRWNWIGRTRSSSRNLVHFHRVEFCVRVCVCVTCALCARTHRPSYSGLIKTACYRGVRSSMSQVTHD